MEALPSLALLLVVAVATAGCGALLSRRLVEAERAQALARRRSGLQDGVGLDEVEDVLGVGADLTLRHALAAPLVASAALLVLFFVFAWVQSLLVVYVVLVTVLSAYVVLGPPLLASTRARVVPGALLALAWLLSSNVLVLDLMACLVALGILATVRLPSLRVASVLLLGLLAYDLVWVLLAPHVPAAEDGSAPARSVMVAVALQQPGNPAHAAAAGLPASWRDYLPSPPQQLEMPNKILVPVYGAGGGGEWAQEGEEQQQFTFRGYAMLGVGDIAIPGLLLALAARLDRPPPAPTAQEQEQPDDDEYGLGQRGELDEEMAAGGGREGDGLARALGAHHHDSDRRAATMSTASPRRRQPVVRAVVPTAFPALTLPYPLRRMLFLVAWGCGPALSSPPTSTSPHYLLVGLAGYAVGLLLSFAVSSLTESAQPALIYIVPSTLGPLLALARLRGDWRRAWDGVGV
jgi:hypothetical protein